MNLFSSLLANRFAAVLMVASALFASGHTFLLAAPMAEASEESTLHHDTATHESDSEHVSCPEDLHSNTRVSSSQHVFIDTGLMTIVDLSSVFTSPQRYRLHEFVAIPPELPSDQKTVLLL